MADSTMERVIALMPTLAGNAGLGAVYAAMPGSTFIIDPTSLPEASPGTGPTTLKMRIKVPFNAVNAGDSIGIKSSSNVIPAQNLIAPSAACILSTAWQPVVALFDSISVINNTAARGTALYAWFEFAYLP